MLYCPAVNIKLTLLTCLSPLVLTGCMMPNREAQTAHNEERIAAEGIIKLEAGAPAPAISAPSTAGTFELSAALAKGRVVLFFFPALDTPNSTRELTQYGAAAAELAAQQITIYGITKATDTELTAFRTRYNIPLELIADPQLVIAQAYGCALPGGQFPQRSTIGLNADGSIAFYRRHQMLKAEILKEFDITTK
jgi:thioredoxin-dependent peroxiredoxin